MKLDLEPTWTMPALAGGEPAWILCRGLNQFSIPHDATLQRWAERSRVRPDDYLVNPRLDTCVQAKDLAALFLKTTFSARHFGHRSNLVVLWEPVRCGYPLRVAVISRVRRFRSRPPQRERRPRPAAAAFP